MKLFEKKEKKVDELDLKIKKAEEELETIEDPNMFKVKSDRIAKLYEEKRHRDESKVKKIAAYIAAGVSIAGVGVKIGELKLTSRSFREGLNFEETGNFTSKTFAPILQKILRR